ncbi:MAG: dephospho-CoA kinase, partial [Candidatus Coatesbacteria bacterium]|nr:dephospho-CoA kinase [Candidatus Coatesbacteria bacterium]
MFLVGLTGGFGSGKSTVASYLGELGLAVVSADDLAREVCEKGEPAYLDILTTFGDSVVADDGNIDRRRLGDIVFSDPASLARLNRIVHPRIIEREQSILAELEAGNPDAIVILDVPLLIEAERHHFVDFVVVVNAPTEQRLERLKKRFGDLDRAALEARMNQQIPLEEKIKLADYVIENGGTFEGT